MSNRVPDFFVVGAQKAGTSTLHQWLEQSKEVALPWSKETHFFRDADKYAKGVDWYRQQFKTLNEQTKIIGEIDPEYMYFAECDERIRQLTVAPKLIFVLRDPIARARSHYQMSVRRGYEPLSFCDALVAEKARLAGGERFSKIHHSYLDRGLYAKQIERMRTTFPNSEILILRFEDLYGSQEAAMSSLKKIGRFIGISDVGLVVDVAVRENPASTPRFTFVRDLIYGKSKLKKFLGKLLPAGDMKIRLIRGLDQLNMTSKAKKMPKIMGERAPIPDFVYHEVIEDLQMLAQHEKIDVSAWLRKYQQRTDQK